MASIIISESEAGDPSTESGKTHPATLTLGRLEFFPSPKGSRGTLVLYRDLQTPESTLGQPSENDSRKNSTAVGGENGVQNPSQVAAARQPLSTLTLPDRPPKMDPRTHRRSRWAG